MSDATTGANGMKKIALALIAIGGVLSLIALFTDTDRFGFGYLWSFTFVWAIALGGLFFVALDEDDLSVKRMRSFMSLMPGETTSCVGCHEHRATTPAYGTSQPTALRRSPSPIRPIAGVPEIFDYPRHVQPILDAHCIECHDYDRRDGGVILSGDGSRARRLGPNAR